MALIKPVGYDGRMQRSFTQGDTRAEGEVIQALTTAQSARLLLLCLRLLLLLLVSVLVWVLMALSLVLVGVLRL